METQRPGSPASPDPVFEALTDSIRFLNGAVVNSKLYHIGHPEMMRPLRRFVETINAITLKHGGITLTPGFEGLRWRGAHVTNESDDQKSLGQLLHREGIAQMTFEMGVEEAETYRLVMALRVNFTSPEYEEETLDSLLWQAELKHIKFAVVKELMEAEAISGRDGVEMAGGLDNQLWQALELEVKGGQEAPGRHINDMLSEDQLRRAIEKYDVRLEAPIGEEAEIDEKFWLDYLTEIKEEDLEVLSKLRAQVAEETETDFLIRLVVFLLRVALARRPEFPPVVVQQLADKALENIYAEVDAMSVARVVNDGRHLFAQIPDYDDEGRLFVREFFSNALAPLRVASILVHMDYEDETQRQAAVSLVSWMSNEGVAALLEWSFSQDYERMRPFYEIIARGAGRRVVQMVESNLETIHAELLVPAMWVMRVVGEGRFSKARSVLVRHESLPVRIAAMSWYGDHLPPEDVGIVVQAIFAAQPAIRRAALGALKKQRPHGAIAMLESSLAIEAFTKLPMDQKKRVCQAYAIVARGHAVPVFENLMRSKLPLIVLGDEPVLEVIEAAVWGILMIDIPKATELVKGEASGWPSARTQICKRVLKTWKTAS